MNNILEKSLAISTAHIKKETNDVLETGAIESGLPFRYSRHQYGFILFMRYEDDEEKSHLDLYPDLAAIVKLARKYGCSLVDLDRDANMTDELETFDW